MENNGTVINDVFREIENIQWEKFTADERYGVEIFKLFDARNDDKGAAAALLRYEPGAKVTRHVHTGYELIFVLEGALINDTGVHKAGALEVCMPGSNHALASEEGCVFLVVWEQPVKARHEDAA